MDFCGWVNNPPPEGGLEWDWLSGESDNSDWSFPHKDHTTNSESGRWLQTTIAVSINRDTLNIWSDD